MFFSVINILKMIFLTLNNNLRVRTVFSISLSIFSSVLEVFSVAAIGRLILSTQKGIDKSNLGFFKILNIENESLYLWSSIFIAIVIFTALAKIIYSFISSRTSALIGNYFSSLILTTTLKQPYSEFIESNSADTISLITKQVDNLVTVVVNLFQLCSYMVSTILLGIAIFLILPQKISIFLLFIPISYIIISNLLKKKTKNIALSTSNLLHNQIKYAQESILMYKDLAINKNYKFVEKGFNSIDLKRRVYESQALFYSVFPRFIIEILALLILVAIAIFASNQKDILLLPTLASIGLAAQKILPSMQGIYSSLLIISANSESVIRVIKHIKKKKNYPLFALKDKKNINKFDNLNMSNISFSYDNQKKLLNRLSIKINSNQFVAIKGESGSGKSTLFDIILGMIEPNFGTIKINNYHLNDCKNSWHGIIQYVGQSIFFIDGTILDNLLVGNKLKLSNNYLKKIIEITGINFMMKENNINLNSKVGEYGNLLSRGQRQRIVIARALLRKPKVLFLDEATNGLDLKSELNFYKNLKKLKITVIVITHSKLIDECFDEIYEIKN